MAGPPWVGDMAERQWADAIAFFIDDKTRKLRTGNYSAFSQHWLLIQDEWRVPMYRENEKLKAAQQCRQAVAPLLSEQAFGRIYISSSKWLIRLHPGPVVLRPITTYGRDVVGSLNT
jgi:hypothetical protein